MTKRNSLISKWDVDQKTTRRGLTKKNEHKKSTNSATEARERVSDSTPGSSLSHKEDESDGYEEKILTEAENAKNQDKNSELHVSKSRAPLLLSSRSHLDKTSFIISEKDDFEKPDSAIFPVKSSKVQNSVHTSRLHPSLQDQLTTSPHLRDAERWRHRLFGFQIKRHYWDNFNKKDHDRETFLQSQKESQDIRYRFKKYFIVMHVIFTLLGVATIVFGASLAFVEGRMRGNLRLNLTEYPKKLYFGTGSSVIVVAIVGQILMLIRRFKTLAWLTYLCMLCVTVTALSSCCFTSMKTFKGAHTARKTLFDLMIVYDNDDRNTAVAKIDALQKGYQCCGVDNFLDWSAFPSGRTSLRTPLSCCRGYPEVIDKYCSQNLLPDATIQQADDTIYARGCLTVMMYDMNTWCLGTGIYSGILVFLFVIHLLFSFFLMTSRRF